MPTKYLATAVAAFGAIGAATTGATFVVPVGPTDTPPIRPVALGAPFPQDPAAVPTVDQLTGVPSCLRAPGVPFASKGEPPPAFTVANIAPAGAVAAASGPKLPPRASAMPLLQEAGVGV